MASSPSSRRDRGRAPSPNLDRQLIQQTLQELLESLVAPRSTPRQTRGAPTDKAVCGSCPLAALSPRGLSRDAAAAYLGVSPGAFDKLVSLGILPGPWLTHGIRRRVWDKLAIDRALDARSDTRLHATSLADYLE